MVDSFQNWRRLLPLFVATTLAPVACLCWLAWQVIQHDRQSQRIHAQEQSEQAADLAASALQRVLAEAEERLASFSVDPKAARKNPVDGEVLIAFERDDLLARAGSPLPYYPALPAFYEPESDRFAAVDVLEFQKKDYNGALRTLEAMTESTPPAFAGELNLRIARIQRNRGNIRAALEAFTKLGTLGESRTGGGQAGLVAQQGRALICESLGRRDDLEREAAAICDDLVQGRWILYRGEFQNSYDQARKWLRVPRLSIDSARLALAEAAEEVWREWKHADVAPATSRSQRALQVGDASILLLTRSTADRRDALLMAPEFLEAMWLQSLRSAERVQGFTFALTDTDGRIVLGRPNMTASMQLSRPVATTPWTLHVVSSQNGVLNGLTRQTTFVLAGIAMMAVLATAGGYLIHRAIRRELRVARLQSDFVAAVSHEFRTPLTALRQLAEMLVNGRVSTDDRRQRIYEALLGESVRLHRLVEGLLNFGRMEAGQLRYRFEPVEPEAFLRDIVSDFERDVAGRGYHVELHGNGRLPQIRADRESLARVFWNLLDNAVKYSPHNQTVWVDLSETNQRLAVRVRDRGVGIPAAEQQTIFEKFVRGAASKEASIQGTGVGLAMASRIVAAHGGDITVESQPGVGSVFTVLLPVAET
jgi:signal transduction histidine kinase